MSKKNFSSSLTPPFEDMNEDDTVCYRITAVPTVRLTPSRSDLMTYTDAAELVRAFDGQAHAIALEELMPVVRLGQARYPQEAVATLVAQARQTPVVDGSLLRATLERWAVKRATDMLPGLLRYRRILLTSGIQQYQLAQMLTQYNASLRFADPLLMTGLPFPLVPRSLAQLEQYAAVALPLAALMQATLQPRYTFAAQQQVRHALRRDGQQQHAVAVVPRGIRDARQRRGPEQRHVVPARRAEAGSSATSRRPSSTTRTGA